MLFGISVYWLSLSFLFDGLTTLVLPRDLELLTPGSKNTVLGLLTFFGLTAAMLIQPFAGLISDRTRNRWGRCGMIGLGLALTMPALAIYGMGGLAAVAAGYVLVLSAASVSQAGQQGFIPDLIPSARRGLASGIKGLMDLAGASLGFVVLGQVLSSGGTVSALTVVAGVLAGGFLITAVLVREPRMPVSPATEVATVLLNPFRINLRKHREFAWLIAARFLFLLGTYMIGRFFLFFVGERLGLNPDQAAAQAGALLAALTLVTLLGGPLAGWLADRFGRLPLMQVGAAMGGIGALLLIATRSSWHVLVFGSVMAVGTAAFTAANWALTADVVPSAEAGRFMALANFGTMGAAAVAGLMGPLVDAANRADPGSGYNLLFLGSAGSAAAAFLAIKKAGLQHGPESDIPNERSRVQMNEN